MKLLVIKFSLHFGFPFRLHNLVAYTGTF